MKIYKNRKAAVSSDETKIELIITDKLNCELNKSTPEILMDKFNCTEKYANYICDTEYKTDRQLIYITKTKRLRSICWTGGGDILSSNIKHYKIQ